MESIYIDPEKITTEQKAELERIARERCFTAVFRGTGGKGTAEVNTFIDCMSVYLKSGLSLNELNYDFIVSPRNVTVLFKAEFWNAEELHRV